MTNPTPSLESLGITAGQRVRFRRGPGRRWHEAVAIGRHGDGSVALRDDKGAARAVPLERIEVCREGRGRAARWESLADVAARVEQLRLF